MEAILTILERIRSGQDEWVHSPAVDSELNRDPSPQRREDVALLLPPTARTMAFDSLIEDRVRERSAAGFTSFDALHLAYAEAAQVDAFLTTDDRLLRKAQRFAHSIRIPVLNPVNWLLQDQEP